MSGSDETPFPVLLQQAAALKASRQAPLRKKFDSWPRWYQSSLFSAEDVVQARVAEFSQRMAFAMDCKQQGNNYFIANEFYEAMNAYERALAVFFWAEPTDPDWKKKVPVQMLFFPERLFPLKFEFIFRISTMTLFAKVDTLVQAKKRQRLLKAWSCYAF